MTNKKYSSEYARQKVKLMKSFVGKLVQKMETTKLVAESPDKGTNLMNKSLPFMKKSINRGLISV